MSLSHDHDHDDGSDYGHSHEDGVDHGHSHDCTSVDYERNIFEARKYAMTRRQVVQAMGAAGLFVTAGGIGAGKALAAHPNTPDGSETLIVNASPLFIPQADDDFGGQVYISGDHHIHTKYSSDAKYAVQRQVAEANYHGLGWMVITDHGSAVHNQISVDKTYPDLVAARAAFPNMTIFAGLELNIPGAEHGTVMLEPNASEKDQIKAFEAAYDGRIVSNTEPKALEAMTALEALTPKPLFFANHPARNGLDSPHEIRAWAASGPNVARGFEGAPGHQAAGSIRDANGNYIEYRGFYGNKPNANSFAGYPPESYFTYGGFDWMTAKLGGVWDSLLGDGIKWWITANSDSHKYFDDFQDVDNSQFNTTGFVAEKDAYFTRQVYGDFRPGQYSRTYVVTDQAQPANIMSSMRNGSMFVVMGDLVDRLLFTAQVKVKKGQTPTVVGLGGQLAAKKNDEVVVTIKVRVPSFRNSNGARPMVDHVDLISGLVVPLATGADPDRQTNASTKIVRRYSRSLWKQKESADGLTLSMTYTFQNVKESFYIRLRGTNTKDRGLTPAIDPDLRPQTPPAPIPAYESPWDDLWFYSNPIFVNVSST